MIKLILFIFLVALIVVVTYDTVQRDKLKQIDKLVDRGIDPEEAFKKVYKDEN